MDKAHFFQVQASDHQLAGHGRLAKHGRSPVGGPGVQAWLSSFPLFLSNRGCFSTPYELGGAQSEVTQPQLGSELQENQWRFWSFSGDLLGTHLETPTRRFILLLLASLGFVSERDQGRPLQIPRVEESRGRPLSVEKRRSVCVVAHMLRT